MSESDLSSVDDDFTVEYPGSDPKASECFVNLIRVGAKLDGELSRRLRAEAKLSLGGLMILATLDGLGGQATASEIGKHTPITSASVTSLIDTCERNQYVKRAPDPEDRRRIPVTITRKGRDLMDRLLPGLHRLESQVLAVLTPKEQDSLLKILAKVQGSITEATLEPAVVVEAPRSRPERLKYTPLD